MLRSPFQSLARRVLSTRALDLPILLGLSSISLLPLLSSRLFALWTLGPCQGVAVVYKVHKLVFVQGKHSPVSFRLCNAPVVCVGEPPAVILGSVSLYNQVGIVYKLKPKCIAIDLLEFRQQLRYKEQEQDQRQQGSLGNTSLGINLFALIPCVGYSRPPPYEEASSDLD